MASFQIPRAIQTTRTTENIDAVNAVDVKHWITVNEAAILTGRKASYLIQQIQKGKLTGKLSSDHPYNQDGKENYIILLEDLPHRAQYQYYLRKIPEKDYLDTDFISPRLKLGKIWEDELVNISQLVKDVSIIKSIYYGSGKTTQELRRLAACYGISLATLYRFTGQQQIKKVSLLYLDPVYMQYHLPRTMCLRSVDFAYALFLDPHQKYSMSAIYREMLGHSDTRCSDCPYHPDRASNNNSLWKTPCCVRYNQHMIIPNNAKTIRRLMEHVPPQVICYCREGFRAWRSEYAPFSMRYKPLMVNDNWQSDHHVFNIFVRIKVFRYKNEKRYEKEIAVRPVLTAWMDSATGCIVGWVISVLPNSDTIAEAFCRSCTYTLGDSFTGLPHSVIMDCGADYKSKLLEDIPEYYKASLASDDALLLNKRFSGLGVLRVFSVDIYHCLPYHPQSKPIEHCFDTLENEIEKLPGWCYRKVSERPEGFQKHLETLLQQKKLLTMEEFSNKFQTEILPAYHGKKDDSITNPDLPGWTLNIASMTPMQRYQAMEKSRSLIPSWQSISIIKRHHESDCLIQPQGIRFRYVYYDSDELKSLRGQKVDILYLNVSKPFAPSSVTVVYQGNYLCEAYPIHQNSYTGTPSKDLSEISFTQNRPAREIKRIVENINHNVSSILPPNATASSLDHFERSQEGHREQLRQEAYSVPYVRDMDATNQSLCTDTQTLSEFQTIIQSNSSTSKSDFCEGLDFLFGEDY